MPASIRAWDRGGGIQCSDRYGAAVQTLVNNLSLAINGLSLGLNNFAAVLHTVLAYVSKIRSRIGLTDSAVRSP